jgi:hypothetical protein
MPASLIAGNHAFRHRYTHLRSTSCISVNTGALLDEAVDKQKCSANVYIDLSHCGSPCKCRQEPTD